MENKEIITETDAGLQITKPQTSRMAIMSVIFAVLGPFFFGLMWLASFLSFHDLIKASPYTMTLFSCGLAWILGLALGIKSLKQIDISGGQLIGKEYAMAGIAISAFWMVLILAGLLLPIIYYINS